VFRGNAMRVTPQSRGCTRRDVRAGMRGA
jgi:hypothetical protein